MWGADFFRELSISKRLWQPRHPQHNIHKSFQLYLACEPQVSGPLSGTRKKQSSQPSRQKENYLNREANRGQPCLSTEAKTNTVTYPFHLHGLWHNTVKSHIWKIHKAWIINVIKQLQQWKSNKTSGSRTLPKEASQLSDISPNSSQFCNFIPERSMEEIWWAQFPSHVFWNRTKSLVCTSQLVDSARPGRGSCSTCCPPRDGPSKTGLVWIIKVAPSTIVNLTYGVFFYKTVVFTKKGHIMKKGNQENPSWRKTPGS